MFKLKGTDIKSDNMIRYYYFNLSRLATYSKIVTKTVKQQNVV
jgi:hypothetical protein